MSYKLPAVAHASGAGKSKSMTAVTARSDWGHPDFSRR